MGRGVRRGGSGERSQEEGGGGGKWGEEFLQHLYSSVISRMK